MPKIIRILLLTGLLLGSFTAIVVQAATPKIDVLTIDGVINPVLTGYIERGIEQAEEDDAVALIIQMDTPGGLDTSMRDIIQNIINAKIPVVVYVSPSGARAASAGAFITLAGHVAVMSPSTAIGAATPVSLEGGEIPDDMKRKIINDAVAYIRSLAESHGRNAEWAEKAVKEGVSATEREAFELNVVDMLAPNLDVLISQLDGRQLTMIDGSVVTLSTQGATVNHISMNWIESFLYAISDPNIAFILLSLASVGLLVEITTPGLGFPGIAGGISLILAFFSLGTLPVNIAGVILIVLAFGLFIIEIFTPTFGLFTSGGVASLVIGSLILFRGGGSPLFQIDLWLIVTVVVVVVAMFVLVLNRVIRAHHRQARTGREDLLGKTAVVKVALDLEGTIFFRGERWAAISEGGRVEPGEAVVIIKVDGLTLHVKKQ